MCDKPNYLLEQEVIWKREAHRAKQQVHAQCLWTFNRFEITRIQWKATGVPKLTYANSVLASRASNQLTAELERAQTAVGKWAMGISGHRVASEFVRGELGWSTFEAREAQSKIRYFTRIGAMGAQRWPRMIISMMAIENLQTEAVKRMRTLSNKYSCGDIPLEYTGENKPRISLFNSNVKKRVKEKMEEKWRENMNSKSSLEGRPTQRLYINSRGSALMALARAGMLPTRSHRARYQHIDPHCIKCGTEEETIPHIIMECTPHHFEDNEIAKRLGFTGDEDGNTRGETRKLLENWENETRRIC